MKMRSGRTLVEMHCEGKIAIGRDGRPHEDKTSVLGILGTFEVDGARNRCRALSGKDSEGRKGGNVQSDKSWIDHGANLSILTSMPNRVMVM